MTWSQLWDSGGSELLPYSLESDHWVLSNHMGVPWQWQEQMDAHSHFNGLLSSLCLMQQSGGARLRVHEVGDDTGDPSLENPSVSKHAQAPPSWASPSFLWSETQRRSLPCKKALQRGVWNPSREQMLPKTVTGDGDGGGGDGDGSGDGGGDGCWRFWSSCHPDVILSPLCMQSHSSPCSSHSQPAHLHP